MAVIIEFIMGIAEAIVTAFTYLIDSVKGIANVVKMLLYFTPKIPLYFTWLPAECLTILGMIFGIAVLYKILGREG